MNPRFKGVSVLLVCACFAAPGLAQSTLRAERITAPVKDAGILRVATGTWDRNPGSSLALGAFTVFNNNVPNGYYNPQDPNHEQVGEGRAPSTDSEGTADVYDIMCWQTAYCTRNVLGPNITIDARWFEQYNTCNDPDLNGGPGELGPAFQVGCSSVVGLPGTIAIGTLSCWVVTIDMTGTNDVFALKADGNGVFDGVQDLDDFGWGIHMNVSGGGGVPASTGLIIAGDPLNGPFGAGTNPAWGFAAGPDGTGLHERDQFFIGDTTDASFNGCYWFGGYISNHIWAGHWHQLLGDDSIGTPGTNYCTSTVNSTGCASTVSASGTASIGANDLVLTADNLPSQPGIFIAGPDRDELPFYCSVLCIDLTGLQRFSDTSAPSGGIITEAVDYANSAPGGLNVMAGMTFNYQRWNRDPVSTPNCQPGVPNSAATFSDAYAITHTP